MRHGIVLFTADRGITPAQAAKAAEDRGFDAFYVPEHTHIPVKREAAHPGTGNATLPDDRYLRTLDPWVSLATAAAVTSRIRLGTAVALPVESDPVTLAKTIATLDRLSGGRVTVGAGFGWNTDELADHGVPAGAAELIWGLPDAPAEKVAAYLDRLAAHCGISPGMPRAGGQTVQSIG
jgi:alkanesulfonate monooxygenase SsuD/methylene tetrahydromethanopterin reductase-like flavin-dependent oxidoreductase (luciferase family)